MQLPDNSPVKHTPVTHSESAAKASAQIELAGRIHAALPQTQCTRCGYPDCAAYAVAIAKEQAAINQCPPGGTEGIRRLAAITGRPATVLNLANGTEGPRSVAVIDEKWCIGCTLCLPVCPADAILGSNKMMHTVIESHCTGCELCIPVCPVDCISLENVTGSSTGWAAWSQADADKALSRYKLHSNRSPLNMGSGHKSPEIQAESVSQPEIDTSSAPTSPEDRKRAVIEAAMTRARVARQGKN